MIDLRKLTTERARGVAIAMQIAGIACAALIALDAVLRMAGTDACVFPEIPVYLKLPGMPDADPTSPFARGLPVNVFEVLLLAVAGLFTGLARWQHAGLNSQADGEENPARRKELANKAFIWTQADIYATLTTTLMGVYLLFNSADRFLEMHATMQQDIRLARHTLDSVVAVHVDVDTMRRQMVAVMTQNGLKQDVAVRLSDQLVVKMDDLRAKTGSVMARKLDSLQRAVELSMRRGAADQGLTAVNAALEGLHRRLERIEEHIGSAPKVPGERTEPKPQPQGRL